MKKIPGVYAIRCSVSGKMYIGSSVDLDQRKYKQFYDLQHNDSKNKPMQAEYNAYGEASFSFEVLEYCENDRIKIVEQKWIDSFWKSGALYNRSPSADSPKGVKHTEETIAKFKKRVRPPISEETRIKFSNAMKNRPPPSAETREKIRVSKLGNDYGKYNLGRKNKPKEKK